MISGGVTYGIVLSLKSSRTKSRAKPRLRTRQHPITVLLAIEPDRCGIVGEQIDDRGAIEPDIVQSGLDALCAGATQGKTQLQTLRLLDQALRVFGQNLKPFQVDKQELFGEGEVLLQVPIPPEGVERVGAQAEQPEVGEQALPVQFRGLADPLPPEANQRKQLFGQRVAGPCAESGVIPVLLPDRQQQALQTMVDQVDEVTDEGLLAVA